MDSEYMHYTLSTDYSTSLLKPQGSEVTLPAYWVFQLIV